MTNVWNDRQRAASDASGFGEDRSTAPSQQGSLKNKASEMSDTLGQTAREQASKAKEAAADLGATANRKLQGVMQDQKNAGADYIQCIAEAIHRAAGEFDRETPKAAQYIRQAGSQVENLAATVREREPRELVQDLEDFARRRPAIFFGGAMLAGFAALRFLKSAPIPQQRPEGG